ncbi:hypothetical protein NliqN6_1009 [Naganishia liquefaciens]|uniref:Peroxin/Ferlin domain-containing protein n=1 Tax=Naganishia liquefaciens TaxID=104408 RepID=A0A8H3TP29_9TREE|nr:hypothetical protein NliqN6_1009 [Naganishia liquefaciens]
MTRNLDHCRILFRGIPYFSPMTLFPFFDPAAWSLVNAQVSFTSIQPTTIQAAAENPPRHVTSRSRSRHWHSKTHRFDDKAVPEPSTVFVQDTPFTPSSFQLPSPAWRWTSEWSVAMQTDGRTDEHGWEYNWIFKSGGWHAHVNKVGWAGWVRRRKWTRLREYRDDARES